MCVSSSIIPHSEKKKKKETKKISKDYRHNVKMNLVVGNAFAEKKNGDGDGDGETCWRNRSVEEIANSSATANDERTQKFLWHITLQMQRARMALFQFRTILFYFYFYFFICLLCGVMWCDSTECRNGKRNKKRKKTKRDLQQVKKTRAHAREKEMHKK